MKYKTRRFLIGCLSLLLLTAHADAQEKKIKFNYAAQKRFIPAELGRVFLGMPLKDFVANFDFKQSEVEDRYGRLEVKIPLSGKGSATSLYFKAHGLSAEELAAAVRAETVKVKDEFGEYEREVKRLDISKIPADGKAFVYELAVTYKKDFDLKSFVTKTFGKPSSVHQKGTEGYFYDSQWRKETADGLKWLIRAFHENDAEKELRLIGAIDGTEWDLNR